MSIEWDMSQVDRLAADLGKGTARLVKTGRQAIEHTMTEVKQQAVRNAKGININHAKVYPASISYDFKPSLTSISGEVGPTLGSGKGQQGSFGGLLEDGGPHNRAQNNLKRALEENMDDFMKGVEKAADDALGDV